MHFNAVSLSFTSNMKQQTELPKLGTLPGVTWPDVSDPKPQALPLESLELLRLMEM